MQKKEKENYQRFLEIAKQETASVLDNMDEDALERAAELITGRQKRKPAAYIRHRQAVAHCRIRCLAVLLDGNAGLLPAWNRGGTRLLRTAHSG